MSDVPAADLYAADGTRVGEVDLNPDIFGIEPHGAVMHQVVIAQLAAARAGTHSTKTRAEVRGGGRKPWRQKGLGRARHGSIRSPQWAGGGVAHGPKPRDYSQRTPKKMRRLALRSALSTRAAAGQIKVVETFDLWSEPKTKQAVSLLEAMEISGKVLLIAVFCLPTTLAGALIGARVYAGVSEQTFRMVILVLLLGSGIILIGQTASA